MSQGATLFHRLRFGCLVWLFASVLTAAAAADRITLKDGSVIEGTAIKRGDGYWIRTPDGSTRTIPNTEIEKFEKGTPPAAPATPEPTAAPGAADAAKPKVAGNLASAKHRADVVEAPMAAVAIWQEYIETKPSPDDLKVATEEMARWKKLSEQGAEKIKGKWVGGEERKAILDKANALSAEAETLMRKDQTLQSIKKFEEAQAVYPNSFRINFWLGYVMMLQHDEDKAIKYFEQSLKQKPNCPEATGNIALALIGKKQYQRAIVLMQQAIEAGDSPELVQNLVTALASVPETVRKSTKAKQAMETANLLSSKYRITGPEKNFRLIGLRETSKEGGDGAPVAGMWSGTGFIVSADGLILTNRHVVDGAKTLMVVLNGNVQKTGEVVKIDDEQDLAIIRVKADGAEMPFVNLAGPDAPKDGAECTVMGFPLIDRLGASIKITRGIVSSAVNSTAGADVVIDAKVNPGNSGGPILDKYGNVMAIVSMKSLSSTTEDSYGLGISAGHIRKFLEKNKITITPAASGGDTLSAEQVASKVKPATVCILSTR